MPTETDLRQMMMNLADQAPTADHVMSHLALLPQQSPQPTHHRARWVTVGAVAAATAAIAVIVPLSGTKTTTPGGNGGNSTGTDISPTSVSSQTPAATTRATSPAATSTPPVVRDPKRSGPGLELVPGTQAGSVPLPSQVSPVTTGHGRISALPATSPSTNIGAGPVGIAFTPSITFPRAVTDRAAVTGHLHVTVNGQAVTGSWVWALDPYFVAPATVTARFRPASFWDPASTVTVTADLAGVALNPTQQGAFFAASFKVRPDAVRSTIDVRADSLTVTTGTHVTARYHTVDPIEAGGIVTDGIHTVSMKYLAYYHGPSAAKSTWVVRFSDAGGLVQATDGPAGTSRPGFVRLSADDAKLFYAMTNSGDPIQVVDSGEQISAGDGDWSYSYPQWVALARSSQIQ